MNKQEILANKPDGASNVSDNGVYYYSDDGIPMNYWARGEEWVESGGIYHLTRSIADIEEIESLRAQLKMAKADGVREVAKQMNTIYASEHNQKKVPPEQFGWWNRAYGYMNDFADSLSKGEDCERD